MRSLFIIVFHLTAAAALATPKMVKTALGGGSYRCSDIDKNDKVINHKEHLPISECNEVASRDKFQFITVLSTARCVPLTQSGLVLDAAYSVDKSECLKGKKPQLVPVKTGDGPDAFTCAYTDGKGVPVQGESKIRISECGEEESGQYAYVKFLSKAYCVPVTKNNVVLAKEYAVDALRNCTEERKPKLIKSKDSILTYTCEYADRMERPLYGEENLSLSKCGEELGNAVKLVEIAGESKCVAVTKNGHPLAVTYSENINLDRCVNQMIVDSEAKKIAVSSIHKVIADGINSAGEFDTERLNAFIALSISESYMAETSNPTSATQY